MRMRLLSSENVTSNVQFEPQVLSDVVGRSHALGELAQVFSHMVQTVKAREQELEKLLQAYGRFVPDEYLQFLGKQSIVDFQLGDRSREQRDGDRVFRYAFVHNDGGMNDSSRKL